MKLKSVTRFLSSHTQIKVAAIFFVIALTVFIWRGKAGNDNWSDEIFYAEFIGFCSISVLLILFVKYLPRKHAMLPWLFATLAMFVLIAYVETNGILKAPSLADLLTNFTSFGIYSLRFFGLFAGAPEGDSTRPALIDAQIVVVAGYLLGIILQKYLWRTATHKET
jgi:hypothetical protein